MAISKIIYKSSAQGTGTVWMDATPATAAAADITAPKTALIASGQLVIGTGSGGGGGLEYEMGTYTPATDESSTTISFSNTHTSRPMYVNMQDISNQAANSTTNLTCSVINFADAFGAVKYSESNYFWGRLQAAYGSNFANSTYNVESGLAAVLTTTGFVASTNSTSRYWKSGRTYKWIAVWAPPSS